MEEDIRKENLKINNLSNELIRDINKSNLSIGSIYFILKDIYKDIEKLYIETANSEYDEFCEEVQKKREEQEQSQSNKQKQDIEFDNEEEKK
jgi:hypothetical protein